MIAIRSNKLVVSGLFLVPLMLLGLAGIVGADTGPEPGIGLQAEDRVLLGTGTPGTPNSPKAIAPSSSACRVVTTPFEADKENEEVVWTRIENAGTGAATLNAMELGWRGDMVLRGIVARRPNDDEFEVYSDPATSPALVALRVPDEQPELLTLEPGAQLDVALSFDTDDGADVLTDLVSTVAYLAEGCVAVIGATADDEKACSLELGLVQVKPSEPKVAQFSAENRGEDPIELTTLEVAWPVQINGRLVALHVDGDKVHEFGAAVANSPAVIDLRRIGVKPIELASQKPRTIALVFAKDAAPRHYAVTVAARDGCTGTTSTYISEANPDCGVEVVGFDISGDSAKLRLSNGREVRRALTALEVFWPVDAAGPLTGVRVNGVTAWTGAEVESPAKVRLNDEAYLAASRTTSVQMVFSPEEERDASVSGHTGGDYTIVATLQGGCTVAFSTLAGHPLGCSLSAGDVIVDPADREVQVTLINAAANATLRQLAISWPARNGPLTRVSIGNEDLLDKEGEVEPGPRPFPIELGTATVVIPRSASQDLQLQFRDRASRNGYMLSLEFESPTGESCQLLVTSRDSQPDCRLSLGPPSVVDFRYIDMELENHGRDEVEIRFLSVDWPNSDPVNGISQITLVDPARPEPLVVWQPDDGEPGMVRAPVQVVANGTVPPIIDPGKSVKLRFRFIGLLDGAMAEPQNVLQVTLGTVEECQASYSRDGQQLPPGLVTFDGVIRELPNNSDGSGMFGKWVIESFGENREVEVDRATRINPNTVTPQMGDLVAVEAIGSGDDLKALSIAFQMGVPGETLHGAIQDMDDENDPPAWVRVTDRHVYLVRGTLIQGGELKVNAEVSVDGKTNPDGSITAVRISVNRPPSGVEVEFSGVIQARTNSDEVDGEDWAVDKYTVVIPSLFVPDPANPDPELRPADGKRVLVTGQLEGRKIHATKMPEILRPPVVRRVSGTVLEKPADGLLGDWLIQTSSGEVKFAVDSLAVVDTRSAPAVPGMAVETVVEVIDGRHVALRLRMEWP